MKVVPLADQSGHVPLCSSKNPVLGVFRHHCGEIATVHQPKGRKAKLRYLLCTKCGCDQCSGDEYQARIRAQMQPSIEALEQFESIGSKPTEKPTVNEPLEPNKNAVAVVVEPIEEKPPVLTETKPKIQPEPTINEPKKAEEPTDKGKSLRVGICATFGAVFGGLLALAL